MKANVVSTFSVFLIALALNACSKRAEPSPTSTPISRPTTVFEPSTSPSPQGDAIGLIAKVLDKPAEGTEAYSTSRLHSEQRRVIDALDALGAQPFEALSAEQARTQPSVADAALKLLSQDGKDTAPEEVGKVEDRQLHFAWGKVPVHVYTPVAGKAPYPVVLYFHGGGFVSVSNQGQDASARAIANAAKAVVVAVDYRLSPEHKFPAAHEDAFAAYKWLLKNATSVHGDPTRIAVLGEDSGGNLAANVAIAARDTKLKHPLACVLIYPWTNGHLDSESYRAHRYAKPLNAVSMRWFTEQFFRTPADADDPRIHLVSADLKGLPPMTIINAEVDPLRSDGELFAKALTEAGVDVKQKTFKGMAHEFFGQGALLSDARDAVGMAASRLSEVFER